MKERDFQRAVMDLAELSGWETFHCRTSMQQGRYMTATTGTMAKGWPDLVLVQPRERRLIFAELKGERGRTTPDQERVLLVLQALFPAGRVYVWRPSDWEQIRRILSMKEDRASMTTQTKTPLDPLWDELIMDALASDGPIADRDVKEAVARWRPKIEATAGYNTNAALDRIEAAIQEQIDDPITAANYPDAIEVYKNALGIVRYEGRAFREDAA